jgi:GH25 family lysozyme M1 (1,4-beta-N-acetylmuramidase)
MPEPLKPVPIILELSRYNEFIVHREAVDAGLVEAILCAGVGRMADPYFVYNWTRFRKLGCKVSAYWEFSPYVDSCVQERCARAVLGGVDYDPETSRCWVAIEIAGVLDQIAYSSEALIFTRSLQAAAAPNVGIYTSREKWRELIGAHGAWGSKFDLYVAHYNLYVQEPDLPDPWKTKGWSYWQYQEVVSSVPGIHGEVTFNRIHA